MSQINNLKCNSCNYTFDEEDAEFYFNENLTEFKESLYLFSTFQEIAKSPLSGNLYITYCDNCNKFIKTYEVIKNEKKLSNEEIKALILKQENDNFEKVIQIKSNDMHITCPKCNKTIERQLTDGSSCPKCENGKLLFDNIQMIE